MSLNDGKAGEHTEHMNPLSVTLSQEDLAQCGWEQAVTECDQKVCSCYSDRFLSLAQQAEQSGNATHYAALWLLAFITRFVLLSENPNEPFGARGFVTPNFRVPGLEDISEGHLAGLKEWLPEVNDPELQARVADVLWSAVPRRDYRVAGTAIDAYLASAARLEDPAEWPYCVDRIERALRLAALVGGGPRPTNAQFMKVISHIEATLGRYAGEDPLFLSARLMELLQEHRAGDPVKYVAIAEKLATRAESIHNRPDLARLYWRIKARWHSMAGDIESQRAAQVRAAETYVSEADAALALSPANYHLAAGHIEHAIHAYRAIQSYRDVPGVSERLDTLQRLMADCQEKGMEEMAPISVEVDFNQPVEAAVAAVTGRSLADALLVLALIGPLPKVAELRSEVESSLVSKPLSARIAHTLIRGKGRVVGTMPGLASITDAGKWKEAVDARAHRAATLYHQIRAVLIDAARQQIVVEHNARISDLRDMVTDSTFVPPGRELFYARGLHAGLTGDYLTAVHLLLPQAENSIRYVLQQVGVIPYALDDAGIQDAYLLNTLLDMPEFEATVGEDLAFDLRGVLNERPGWNLRNEALHGLMGYEEFYGAAACYFWWLTLRLCLVYTLSDRRGKQEQRSDAPPPQDEAGTAADERGRAKQEQA
ncbi:MAG TPA: DUF4209 domain-containing protein [Chloroflexia bacterium]|nr:DUF4209 domain-containing protein [Chloroflexia bacterium]